MSPQNKCYVAHDHTAPTLHDCCFAYRGGGGERGGGRAMSWCKIRETFQVGSGKLSKMMSDDTLAALGGSTSPSQASGTLSVARRTLQGPSTGIRARRASKSTLEWQSGRAGAGGSPASAHTRLAPPWATSSSCSHKTATSTRTFSAFTHTLKMPHSLPLEIAPSRSHSFPVPWAE